jgi:type IV pilus assembly protein PilE
MRSAQLNTTSGFTMIEMLMAVAIMGILVAIAYPAYQDSVMKSHRADGIAAGLALQVAQERFRGSCKFYAQSIGASDTCGASAAASTVASNSTSNEGYYTLSIASSTASGNSYTIVLTPTGSQAGDSDCSPMTIAYSASNPSGLKAPTDCW